MVVHMMITKKKNNMPTKEQFDRVEKLIWGLYIFIPLTFILGL